MFYNLFNFFKPQSKKDILLKNISRAVLLEHKIKDYTRYNYDCIGVACVLAKKIAKEFNQILISEKNWEDENSTMEKIQPEFIEVVNSPYNNFGLGNMINFGNPIPKEGINSGDWLIWQKKNKPYHGHIVTVLEYHDNLISVISGTTNGKARVDAYFSFEEIDKKYTNLYGLKAKIIRPRMR
jgi:hypothetical protein